MNAKTQRFLPSLRAAIAAASVLLLAACGGGSGNDSTTVAGNIPVVYAKRANTVGLDPLTGSSFAPGGDLMMREVASASAPEYNITAAITQGVGDVTDPEVSYDGSKVVFAMNCPASNTSTIGGVPACTGRWNIWEYDMSSGGLTNGTLRRVTDTTTNDDVGPAYLPAGAGFVFSSNRQATSYVNQALGHSYYALDEYERQQVFNLHTMDNNGNNITQISFDQSHERNPVVRPDGTIMYSRWEHVADRNRFTIFKVNPDGTNLFVLYGAHADGNSFLHPRDMDPSGPYAGYVSSDLMSLDRTHGGGALMIIDAADYADQNNPVNTSVPATGGQVQATAQALNYGEGPSLYGRITTPFPLWDGTNRFLVSYTPCEVTNAGVVVSCATLSSTEMAALDNPDRLLTQIAADPVQDNVPPSYAIYMFDPAAQTWTLVAAPPVGFMYTDPIPIQARTEPSAYQPSPLSHVASLATAGMAELTVASVYDTDLLNRMGQVMLTNADVPTGTGGCTTATPASSLTAAQNAMIPQTTPPAGDTRPTVADIKALRDPANPAYNCTPLRFIRAIRAVAPPSGATGERAAIGDTNFEQTQILGYAPIQPDGSFQLVIPANTPVAFAITDSQGRNFQVHTDWIQARPGEVCSCDGCHSPRRGGALNSGTLTNAFSASNPAPTWNPSLLAVRQPGDTMAQTYGNYLASQNASYTLLTNPAYQINPNGTASGSGLQYTDLWALNTGQSVTARPTINLNYSGLVAPETAPTNGIINYPDHVQPIWNAHCISCHNSGDTKLNLENTIAGTGRYVSYEDLMVGPPLLDSNGNPVLVVTDGVEVVENAPALVYSSASESQVVGLARQSRLIEILSGQTLMSSSAAQTQYPTPANHTGLLNASEMLLITEWVDTGGKYYNDPFNSASQVQLVNSLSQSVFASTIDPILMANCAANCHLAKGSGGTTPPGGSFAGDKFVLTGDATGSDSGTPSGDYGNVLSLIGDVCKVSDPTNYILSVPSVAPHPAGSTLPAPLPVGSANYNTIAAWISSGC